MLNVFSMAVAFATMLVARFAAFSSFSFVTALSAFAAAAFTVLFDFTESEDLAFISFAVAVGAGAVYIC